MKSVAIVFSLLLLSACTIVPAPIAVGDDVNLVAYETIDKSLQQPTQAGQTARWGGEIVAVTNLKEHSEIEVVLYPETGSGKPQSGRYSPGRFKAIVAGFVDPLVLEQGRLITVVGKVGDITQGIIGEQDYWYPTITAEGYYLWQESSEYEVESYLLSQGVYGPHFVYRGFVHPWNDPFWGLPYRQRVRVINRQSNAHGHNPSPEPPQPRHVSPRPPNDSGGPNIAEPRPNSPRRHEH